MNPGEGVFGQFRDPSNPDCYADFPADQQPRPCQSVKPRRTYRALEVVAQHRPTKNLFVLASYVYSRLTGNYDGLISNSTGAGTPQVRPNTGVDFDYVDQMPNNSGRLSNDRTHQLKVSGYTTLAFGLTAGVVTSYVSGQPLSLYGFPRSGTGHPQFLIQRGTYGELPSTYNVDLHLEYALRAGAATIVPVLDVFNVTNVQRATARRQTYNTYGTSANDQPPYTNPTAPQFGKDVAWQPPRLIRLGLKAVF